MAGWYGCDLDGTLCRYAGWVSEHDMGEPVPRMIERIKEHLSNGEEVRIVTARVSPNQGRSKSTIEAVINTIQDWTEKHLGVRLAVTCEKDFEMIWLYDDRCKQVIPNTGILLEDIIKQQDEERLKLAKSC